MNAVNPITYYHIYLSLSPTPSTPHSTTSSIYSNMPMFSFLKVTYPTISITVVLYRHLLFQFSYYPITFFILSPSQSNTTREEEWEEVKVILVKLSRGSIRLIVISDLSVNW
jgi:hypothetical protein